MTRKNQYTWRAGCNCIFELDNLCKEFRGNFDLKITVNFYMKIRVNFE